MINLVKNYLNYGLIFLLVSSIGYIGYLKYDFMLDISSKNKEIKRLDNKIKVLDANISNLNVLLLKNKDECKNKILHTRQNNIQQVLDKELERLKNEAYHNENTIGKHTLNLND